MSNQNSNCNEKDYYDTTMLFEKDPNVPSVRMLRQCEDTFKFNNNPKVYCPPHNYLNFSCLDDLGKDLVNHEYLVPPIPETQEQRAIRASIANQWKNTVSLEGCTVSRIIDWTPSSKIDKSMNTN